MRGKAFHEFAHLSPSMDHPRACGEKLQNQSLCLRLPRSPPRVRGKAAEAGPGQHRTGITPAHAGKRQASTSGNVFAQDHPRTRGEKGKAAKKKFASSGSPPHTRGKAGKLVAHPDVAGITPAHAGKRRNFLLCAPAHTDHPRTRGEKSGLKL